MSGIRGTLLLLIYLTACSGCGPAVEYRPGRPVRLVRAPATGVYELYRRGNRQPVEDTVLLKGDRVGFHRDAQGRLLAIDDRQRLPLAEGKYRWQFEGDWGRSPRTGVDVAGLLEELLGDATQGLILGSIESGIDAGFHAGEQQGLTGYQRKKLRQLSQTTSPDSDESHDP